MSTKDSDRNQSYGYENHVNGLDWSMSTFLLSWKMSRLVFTLARWRISSAEYWMVYIWYIRLERNFMRLWNKDIYFKPQINGLASRKISTDQMIAWEIQNYINIIHVVERIPMCTYIFTNSDMSTTFIWI
jgi:hypothetical protein